MEPDTGIGGRNSRFPSTRITAVLQSGSDDSEARRLAHEAIVSAYWKPVYKYIRLRWRESNEGAKDLTQAFFARAIEKSWFAAWEPEQASFRTFIRVCADRFVIGGKQAAARLKRTAAGFEPVDESYPADAPDFDEYFHREWVRQLFSLAVDQLKMECESRNRSVVFRAFEAYDLAEDGRRPSYAEIADQLSVPISQVTNFLAAARRELRRIVLEQIRNITATEREYRAEARSVLGIEI